MEENPATDKARRRRLGLTLAMAVCATLLTALFAVMAPVQLDAAPNCPPSDPDYPDCIDPPDPPDPSPTQPPLPPSLRVTGRTDRTLSLLANFAPYTSNQTLQRRNGAGWIDIVHRSGTSPLAHDDGGLTPDTAYCYRAEARNSRGSSYSPTVCKYTMGRSIPVWRVQLRIMTGNVSDAGTDGEISASVGGGHTYLDHARDDFERNDVHNYDVSTTGIESLDDIHSIALTNHGDDDWCLRNVVLLVDNEVAFATNFGDPCQWLGDDSPNNTAIVDHATLRAYPIWGNFRVPLDVVDNGNGTHRVQLGFPGYELEQRVEGLVGHTITGTDAYWGHLYGRGVEVAPIASNRVAVDIDLAGDVTATDPEVDVDFELVVATRREGDGWVVDLTMENLRTYVDVTWWQDVLDLLLPCDPYHAIEADQLKGCFNALAAEGAAKVKKQIGNVSKHLNVDGASNVTARFDASGGLIVDATFGEPRPK